MSSRGGAAAVATGILGPNDDPQVTAVEGALRSRGHEPVVLDLSRFPGGLAQSVRDGVASARHLDFASVGSWYVRSLPLPLPFREPQPAGPGGGRHRPGDARPVLIGTARPSSPRRRAGRSVPRVSRPGRSRPPRR